MPIPTLVVAVGIRALGNHYLPVAFFKVVLLLIPIEITIFLVWQHLPQDRLRKLLISLLLLVPFALTPFLADIVNMQVEEGYSYGFLALALALLLFTRGRFRSGSRMDLVHVVIFAIAVDAIYLSKSSMAPATFVLTIAFCLRERRTLLRLLVLALAAAAPLGWAMYQHHSSGRYALGTSLDGINLHKGNNDAFLLHYPPPPGQNLD